MSYETIELEERTEIGPSRCFSTSIANQQLSNRQFNSVGIWQAKSCQT